MIIITKELTLQSESLRPEHINIGTIARGLSHMPRFSGQIDAPWNVALHSMLVEEIVALVSSNPKERLMALLHDASEAYIADVPTPLKRLCPAYYEAENHIMDCVVKKFGVEAQWPLNELLQKADKLALYVESRLWFPGRELLICGFWDQTSDPWVTDVEKQMARAGEYFAPFMSRMAEVNRAFDQLQGFMDHPTTAELLFTDAVADTLEEIAVDAHEAI